MTALDKELAQLESDMYSDVLSLVDKYMTITGWDIPENDEDEARKRIIAFIKKVVNDLEEKN